MINRSYRKQKCYHAIAAVITCLVLFQAVSFLSTLSFSSTDPSSHLPPHSSNAFSKYIHQVYSPHAPSASLRGDLSQALPRVSRRVDSTILASLSAAVDTLNPPQPTGNGATSFGNLSRFTALRSKYFDVDSKYEGAHLSLLLNSSSVVDVTLTPTMPYASGLAHATASISNLHNLVFNVLDGYSYNRKDFAALSNYTNITPAELDSHRHRNLARVPKLCRRVAKQKMRPWLLQFSNVWMTGNGEILLPISSRSKNEWDVIAFQYQGGCCITHWSSVKRKRIVLRNENRCRTTTKIGFSITQNHGAAYFHVTNEVIPRFLTFWEVALSVIATSGGKIAAPSSTVVRSVMRSLGIPTSKMLLLGPNQPCFFEKLFVPAPFHHGSFERDCLQRTVVRIIAENALGDTPPLPSVAPFNRPKPLVVLIERALSRKNGRCKGVRCMANFPGLLRAVEYEFRGQIDLQILSASDKDVMRRGIELFSRATVVVGMHGAGLTNIMFMRGKGTYVIHLGWEVAWQIYHRMAKKSGVDFVNIVTDGASQNGENAFADISLVVHEIRKFLQKEGFPLDRSRMATKARWNAIDFRRLLHRTLDRIWRKFSW